MTPEQFAAHRDIFREFIDQTHVYTAMIVLGAFVVYGLAGYLAYREQWIAAAVSATVGYLVFRQFRSLSMSLAELRLQGRSECAEALQLLREEFKTRNPKQVYELLERLAKEDAETG
ncbi:MAG: hypothetical protein P8Y64_12905 [Gammaproteobacteria bacterium]|jgi:putative Mn2+ efflux pump MntP